MCEVVDSRVCGFRDLEWCNYGFEVILMLWEAKIW